MRLCSCSLLLVLSLAALAVADDAPVRRWEPAIAAFETQDRASPPQSGGNLFVGSSSIRLWNVAQAFPERKCLNRGFGGSQLPDVVEYVDRIVIPHRPRVIVLYAGDNDLAAGHTPEQVCEAYRAFVSKVQAALPETKIVWIAVKPSPARWKIREQQQAANKLVRAVIAEGKNQTEVHFWDAMLGSNGEPRTELYAKDGLHLSPEGYSIWNERIEPLLAKTP